MSSRDYKCKQPISKQNQDMMFQLIILLQELLIIIKLPLKKLCKESLVSKQLLQVLIKKKVHHSIKSIQLDIILVIKVLHQELKNKMLSTICKKNKKNLDGIQIKMMQLNQPSLLFKPSLDNNSKATILKLVLFQSEIQDSKNSIKKESNIILMKYQKKTDLLKIDC